MALNQPATKNSASSNHSVYRFSSWRSGAALGAMGCSFIFGFSLTYGERGADFLLPRAISGVYRSSIFPMLRQLYDAIRHAIADFFDVPWPAVAAMLVTIALLCAYAYLRTTDFALSHGWPGSVLLLSVFIALGAAGNYFKRR